MIISLIHLWEIMFSWLRIFDFADNVISGPLSGNSKVVATQLRTQSSEPQYSMDASREHIINLPSQAAIQQQKMIQQPSEVADEMVDMAGTTDRDLSGMITQKGKDIEHPQLPSDSADDHTEQVVLPSDLRPKLYKVSTNSHHSSASVSELFFRIYCHCFSMFWTPKPFQS